MFGMTANADMVVNGGFETGNFSGWTTAGDLTGSGVSSAACPGSGVALTQCTPYSGTYAAFFDQDEVSGSISQPLITTPGDSYTLNYYLEVDPAGYGTSPAAFSVSWDGSTISSETETNPIQSTWALHTVFNLVASTNSTELKFTTRMIPDWFGLDNISVTADQTDTPEPASIAFSAFGLLLAAAARKRFSAPRS